MTIERASSNYRYWLRTTAAARGKDCHAWLAFCLAELAQWRYRVACALAKELQSTGD